MEDGNNNVELNLTVSCRKLRAIMAKLNSLKYRDEDVVSFEFLVGSCFPDAYYNIQEELRRQYTMGYIDGRTEKDEESLPPMDS